jgi:hypothetical protein
MHNAVSADSLLAIDNNPSLLLRLPVVRNAAVVVDGNSQLSRVVVEHLRQSGAADDVSFPLLIWP